MRLQPEQYQSWLRKANDPEWINHRYRTSMDNAMVSCVLDLKDALERIATLESELALCKKRLLRMSEPVSDEEWTKHYSMLFPKGSTATDRQHVDALIRARTEPVAGEQ